MYLTLSKDDFSTAAYELREKVPITRPATDYWITWVIERIRFSPGGRYLFLIWQGDEAEWSEMPRTPGEGMELQVLDLESSSAKQCVWSYRFDTLFSEVQFDFEICGDGSIMLALCESDVDSKRYFI